MLNRRKTERVFLRIPIMVRGVNEQGAPFTEETATVEINRDGARIGLRTSPRPDSELQVTNLASDSTAVLLANEQCPQSYDGLPEWRVKFATPVPEFWGITFDENKEEDQRPISALLGCPACGRQELARISFEEYEILRTRLFLPRLCPHCRLVAKWEVGSPGEGTLGRPQVVPTKGAPEVAEVAEPGPRAGTTAPSAPAQPEEPPVLEPLTTAPEAEEAPALEPATAPPLEAAPTEAADAEKTGVERRRERRLTIKVPILVKARTGEAEKTESADVSKSGLSFTTSLDLTQGDLVEVTVGYGVADSPPVQVAKVAWRRPEGAGPRSLVGVWFTKAEG